MQETSHKRKQAGLAVAAAFAFAAFASAVSAAPPLVLTDGDKISIDRVGAVGGAFGGGEFRASGVSVFNGSSGSFLTFCVEFSEHIALGGHYYVDVDTKAQMGGLGVAGYGGTDPNGVTGLGSYDPLSKGTAWLYTQFSDGTLNTAHGVAYNFAADNAHANSLQLAIWSLEDELSGTASGTTGYAFAHDAVAMNWASVAKTQGALWSDTRRVHILNLYDTRGGSYGSYTFSGNHQDQLYITPVPEPESYAMLLAGLGLMGFAARRRRLNELQG